MMVHLDAVIVRHFSNKRNPIMREHMSRLLKLKQLLNDLIAAHTGDIVATPNDTSVPDATGNDGVEHGA